MASDINILREKNLVEVNFTGPLSFNKLREECQRLGELALEHGKMNYLIDCRNAVAVDKIRTIALRETKHIWNFNKVCGAIGIVFQESDIF